MTVEIKRPLEKKVDEDVSWHTNLRELPHKDGFSIPVFEWSFGFIEGIRGGELRAWPHHCLLTFQDRRENSDWQFESVEEALAKIDEYGWGEPPNIDTVFHDMQETSGHLRIGEDPGSTFEALRGKWQKLIADRP